MKDNKLLIPELGDIWHHKGEDVLYLCVNGNNLIRENKDAAFFSINLSDNKLYFTRFVDLKSRPVVIFKQKSEIVPEN